MSDAKRTDTATARELEEALFGERPRCAHEPDQRCLPECEYGLTGPCVRKRRAEALLDLAPPQL